MPSICLYLQAHQPFRIRRFSVFDIGRNHRYFDEAKNKGYLERIVRKSYVPTNKILLDLVRKTGGRFRVSFSLTGTLLEQLEEQFPEVIKDFQCLVATGAVELLSETYYHSLAELCSKEEFREQVNLHKRKIKELFNFSPKVFRNTELMFSNQTAELAEQMGYKGILTEGVDRVLGWRSPNFVYQAKTAGRIKVLLRNYRLSDDISFRFSRRDWPEWPLTASKFALWLNQLNGSGQLVNLFMDYETFGEHQWESTGIFDFLKTFPLKVLEHPDNNFKTPSEVIGLYKPVGELDIPHTITWADSERDLSAWLGNKMQQFALKQVYLLENKVLNFKKNSNNKDIIKDWRKLQTADHFYYMCTKWFADGDVHKYFNPHQSPYEAFISYVNIINDLKIRLSEKSRTEPGLTLPILPPKAASLR